MPSKDSNQNEQKNGKVVKISAGQKKDTDKKSSSLYFSKIVTYIILAVISIVLIVGIVVPSLGSSSRNNSISFGSYDGEDIVFTPGNYFYRQYQAQAQQSTGSDETAAYQIWNGAYQSTVFHTAMTQIADDAGIVVSEETLKKAIIDSGAYDKDGKFDNATYESTSVESRNTLKKQVEDYIPTRIIISDMAKSLDPAGELEYIKALGDASKAFEYVVFDASLYPDELTREFGLNNPSEFTGVDISIISTATEAEALEIKTKVESGEMSFADAAVEYSQDALAADGGKAGVYYLHEVRSNFANEEEVNELFSTGAGEITRPFETAAGYALYQVEQKPFPADFTDPEVLDNVRSYIQDNNAELVTSYIQSVGEQFIADVNGGKSFTDAGAELSLEPVSVGLTPVDVNSSAFLIGFQYTDQGGYLASLNSDVDAMKALYALEVGEVSSLLEANGSYLVATATESAPMEESASSYMGMLYDYMKGQQAQQELISSIFSSDSFEDNFLTVYLTEIMNVGSAN